ncbi:MAG: sugar-binding protein [Chitinispirillales bacterium]|nr:sugar-binding protein [Chitinispirillales bacterium]
MKKILTFFSVVGMSLFLMSGCQRSDRAGAPLIGIAIPETYVTRWIKDGNSLSSEAEKRGYRTDLQFAEGDQAMQNRQIQSFLTLGARVIIIGSVDEGIAPAIAEAAARNAAVIAYDRLIQNSADYDYYITFNNFKVGELKGRSLVQGLDLDNADADSPKTIALFAGASTDGNAFFFFDGAMSVLTPYIDRGVLKVVGPHPRTSADSETFLKIATEGWRDVVARARMEELLRNEAADITLDAVLAPNDNIARALIDALKADPKYADGLPLVTGQDAEFLSMMSIKNGEQFCTVFKNTTKLAEAAIIMADQIIRGEPINIPGAVLASGDLERIGDTGQKTVKAYLLDPVLITRENLYIPVDAEFYTEAEAEALR